MYSIDELLLIENITYIPDDGPLKSVLSVSGKTVAEYMDMLDMDKLEDDRDYASFYNGFDWRNTLTAIRNNPSIMKARIVDSYIDRAYGGGGGLAAVFVSDEHQEAVVAFRGTASLEWADDMEGAAVTDTLQQINALEYFRTVVRRHDLSKYRITVTGHSKGGNKSKYVTVLDDAVDRCVSFDGQGFSDMFMNHYRDRILKRQAVIENHNVDYDYVNFILNDIGRTTYYYGHDYGRGGFAEAHCPNTFFRFTELGKYTMEQNPDGQSTEMQLLDQFLNSLLRSMPNEKELGESAELVGIIAEEAFKTREDSKEFIEYIFQLVADPKYSDNVSFIIAFFIKYERLHPGFVDTIGGIMRHFGMENLIRYIELVRNILNWKGLDSAIGLTDFLVGHVPSPIVKRLQKYLKSKLGVELDRDQLMALLSVVTMTRTALKTMKIVDDGADIVIEEAEASENSEEGSADTESAGADADEKMDILVLAGGLSSERNISLMTGYSIADALKKKGHRVILLDSYLGCAGLKDMENAFDNADEYTLPKVVQADLVPDLWSVKKRRRDNNASLLGPHIITVSREADLVFIALPGSGSESGRLQGLFDLYGLDYTGSSSLSTTLAMNKSACKQIMVANGIRTPGWGMIKKQNGIKQPVPEGITYPVVVKPNGGGASIGVSAVNDDHSYTQALSEAFKWENEVLVEDYIAGREFSVSIIGDEVYPILEVNGKDGVYDIKNAIRLNNADAYCPADIPEALATELRNTAVKVAKVLNISSYCRVDFRVNEAGEVHCLECDALPNLNEGGRFARSVSAGGLNFEEMCSRIIEVSMANKY